MVAVAVHVVEVHSCDQVAVHLDEPLVVHHHGEGDGGPTENLDELEEIHEDVNLLHDLVHPFQEDLVDAGQWLLGHDHQKKKAESYRKKHQGQARRVKNHLVGQTMGEFAAGTLHREKSKPLSHIPDPRRCSGEVLTTLSFLLQHVLNLVEESYRYYRWILQWRAFIGGLTHLQILNI